MEAYKLPKDKVTYNYRYFLPYAPEWGSEKFCNQRLEELIVFCKDAQIDAVQFFVNTLPGTYYMPAHSAAEQLHWVEWMKHTVKPALEKINISYQLNLQMILGAGSCGLNMRDEYNWGFLVNQYGDESLGCACPLSVKFREIMGEMLSMWASTNPDIIWIDDDFRMHNHGLVTPSGDCDFYCYCDTHLDKFAEFAGKRYSREELVAKVLKPGAPTQLRLQWRQFLGNTMTETAGWINKRIQGASPKTRIALMTSCPDVHSVEGRDWKNLLTALSGKYTPMTRPMCGIYTGTVVPVKENACTYKYLSQSMATLKRLLGDGGIEFGPELENTRFTTWCKSVSNSRYVMILSQLLGTAQITMSLNDLDGSPINQEPTTIPLLRNTKPELEALAALSLCNWRPEGVIFIDDEQSAAKIRLAENAKMQDLGLSREWEDVLLQCGIPAYHASCAEAAAGKDVVVLEAYTAWSPSDVELEKILSGAVLLDADAAFVLQERGFGKYLGVNVGKRQTFAVMAEKYRDDVLKDITGRIPHRGLKWRRIECEGTTVASEFIDSKNRYFPGSMIFENSLGGRVATYASIGDFSYGTFGNHLRVKWLHGILNWLSRDRFPVLPNLPHHGLCVVRSKKENMLVALANLGTDLLAEVKFRIYAESGVNAVSILDKHGNWHNADSKIEISESPGICSIIIKCNLNAFDWLIIKIIKRENKMTEKLKIACIGAGSAGTGHMVRMEKYLPGSCVAFSDVDRSKFDKIVAGYLGEGNMALAGDLKSEPFELRRNFRDLPYYRDAEEMLQKEDINTVIIASFCSHHAEAVALCVRHGVNILLEKPIAITEADVCKVWTLLRDYQKVATVNFSLRGSPVAESARRHIRNGDIGRIVSVQFVNNVHYGDIYFRAWMRTRKNVGSLLLQKGTHDLDLINYFIGLKPEAVAAFGSRQVYGGDMPDDLTCDVCDRKMTCTMSIYRRKLDAGKPLLPPELRRCVYAREIDIDDNQVLAIKYECGVTASYSQTFNAPFSGGQRGGYFIGTEGILELRLYGEFEEHPTTGAYVKGTSTIRITRFNDKPGSSLFETHDWADVGHMGSSEYLAEGFLKLLQGGESSINANVRDGYISAMMCLAADRSIETGQTVKLNLDI